MAFESSEPETPLSLLVRITDPEDHAAWQAFVELYHPVIYRTARIKGLQDADALDVSQQVLMSVGRALARRPHDPARARFRTWLKTVTRNATVNALRTRANCRGTADTDVHRQLAAVEAGSSDEEILELEYQKELFRMAARRIEPEFAPDSWQAFWRTAVEQQPVPEVAAQLGKLPGCIYAARSRIMRRLREELQYLQDQDRD